MQIWVDREGLLQNRARGQKHGSPVVIVHDGKSQHRGFGLKIHGESHFVYLDNNGRYALHLETDGPVSLEYEPGKWRTIT